LANVYGSIYRILGQNCQLGASMTKISDFRKCYITGGAGAIGSRLVRILLARGANHITVIDDLSSGYEWLIPKDDRVSFIKGDICEIFSNGLDLKGALIFHLAAFFANQNSVEFPELDLHTNGLGTLKIFKAAADKGAERIIYASAGCSIAGHGTDAPIREDMPVSLHLDTPYQITKALGEFYANYYLDRVSSVRCRFFNSYGPGEVPGRYRNVIPNFIWLAMQDKPLTITGSGKETRDFIYVDDLIQGLISCAEVGETHGEAINLGTGKQTAIQNLAEMIIRMTSSESEIKYAPRRSWDKSTTRQADIAKARDLIHFDPKVDVKTGLQNTIEWFQRHRDRIRQTERSEF